MIEIEIDSNQLKRLIKASDRAKKKFPRELAAALNAVARKGRTQISKRIRAEVVIKAGDLKELIKLDKKANPQSLSSNVRLPKTEKVSLRNYGARHLKSGVSYRISRKGGRKLVTGGFMGPRPGIPARKLHGGAFIREGASRKPIRKLMGPSPWGVFVKNRMTPEQEKEIRAELAKQMERRIKLNILRAEGLVAK